MPRCASEDEGEVRAPHARDELYFLVTYWSVLNDLSDDTFRLDSIKAVIAEGAIKLLQIIDIFAFLLDYVNCLDVRDVIILHFLHLTTTDEDAYVI